MIIYEGITPLLLSVLFLLPSFLHDDGRHQNEIAFTAYVNDSIPIQVELLYSDDEMPVQYYSHIRTPVCEKDGYCYLITIEIYWDLLGNFIKYEYPPNSPLTKFDHIEFTKQDHEKMSRILSDKTSILQDYAADGLIDQQQERMSEVVLDGVSGATFKSLSSAVVNGAVFSTHTLWHIVNGKIAEQIVQYTESKLTDVLLIKFLQSDNYHYQYYALNKIADEETDEYLPYIIRLVAKGESYVPFFAIEKLPDDVWTSAVHQETLVNFIGKVDFQMQNELLNHLGGKRLNGRTLTAMIANKSTLTEKQLVKILQILKFNENFISYDSLLQLLPLLDAEDDEVRDMTLHILQSRSHEFKEIGKKLKNHKKITIQNN